jgi:Tol biopolymer transport system component
MRKKLLAGMLLLSLAIGLVACRGFFTQAPVAVLKYTPQGLFEAPITVTFDLSDSTDPDGTIVAYTLDFGDGSTPATGTDITVPVVHKYEAEGTYTATLEVEDNAGKKDQDSVVITVLAPRVYFSSDRNGWRQIFRVKLDGTEEEGLWFGDITPALNWNTRDKLAVSFWDGGDWDIGVADVSDLALEHLNTQTYSEIQPTWYYDGSKIAFASDQSGNWEIWTVEYPWGLASTMSQLTVQTPYWALSPSYSPTSGDLVFVSNKGTAGAANGGSALWIWRAGQPAPEVLYDSAGHDGAIDPGLGIVAGLPADGGLSTPAWSPDGTKIAFTSDQGGDLDIYVINADGTGVQNLNAFCGGTPNTTADEFDPWWVETGDAIAFVRYDGANYHVYLVNLNTGTVTQLSSAPDSISPARRSP